MTRIGLLLIPVSVVFFRSRHVVPRPLSTDALAFSCTLASASRALRHRGIFFSNLVATSRSPRLHATTSYYTLGISGRFHEYPMRWPFDTIKLRSNGFSICAVPRQTRRAFKVPPVSGGIRYCLYAVNCTRSFFSPDGRTNRNGSKSQELQLRLFDRPRPADSVE